MKKLFNKELTGNVHIATPIMIGILAVIAYVFVIPRLPAKSAWAQANYPTADQGFGESVRYDYPTGTGSSAGARDIFAFSGEPPGTHLHLNPYRSHTEPFPPQPTVNQSHHRSNFYSFLNQMLRSTDSAYLEKNARP